MNLEQIVSELQPPDEAWRERAREHTAQLVMPTRALGRLHDLVEQLCAVSRTLQPSVEKKAFLVMAGDHGVAANAVSAYPQEVTGQMVATFLRGGAAINVLAKLVDADVEVVDVGIIPDLEPTTLEGGEALIVRKMGHGTEDITVGPAMSRERARRCVETGFDIASERFRKGVELLGTGDMGIGNTTPSAAVAAAITGHAPEHIVGRGTGVDEQGLTRKREAVSRALAHNRPDPRDGLDVLAKVGGFELGAIAGSILAAAQAHKPVVVDGFISTAGALLAVTLCPAARGYIIAAHLSSETGHRLMLEHLRLEPLLQLDLRLGEGSGGALAMQLVEASVRIFREMMTFESAGVSKT